MWDTKGREHGAVSLRAVVQQFCLAYLLSAGEEGLALILGQEKKLKPKKPTTKKQNKKGREEGRKEKVIQTK